MIRLTRLAISADTAIATARYVLPVPAGPSPKVMSPCSIASTYFLWLGERGCTIRFTPADRCLPDSTSERSVTAGSAITSRSIPFSSPFCSVTPDLRSASKSAKMRTTCSTLSAAPPISIASERRSIVT